MLKKRFAAACAVLLLYTVSTTAYAAEEEKELVTLTLNEVAHSIFYAPQYTAIELGYFEEEGISLNLITGFGAI